LLEDQGIEEDEIGRLREMLASKDRGVGLKETASNKTDLKDTSLSDNDRSASK
jgi:hypothetical protein